MGWPQGVLLQPRVKYGIPRAADSSILELWMVAFVCLTLRTIYSAMELLVPHLHTLAPRFMPPPAARPTAIVVCSRPSVLLDLLHTISHDLVIGYEPNLSHRYCKQTFTSAQVFKVGGQRSGSQGNIHLGDTGPVQGTS